MDCKFLMSEVVVLRLMRSSILGDYLDPWIIYADLWYLEESEDSSQNFSNLYALKYFIF